MYDNFTIFVAIPAFNEVDLVSTIEHCLKQAEYPDRVHFGVVTHYNEMDKPDLNFANLKTINVEYPALLGVGPMRSLAVALYDNEDFYLQIDAHMKFDKHWDSYALRAYHKLQEDGVEKPILTTYVPWWSVNEDGSYNNYSEDKQAPSGYMSYNMEEINRVIPQQMTEFVDYDDLGIEYVEHYGFSAHFAFTKASFIYDVAPDTDYMFYGEEPTTALRAWTRGYRMFCTKLPIVWHKNKNLDEGFVPEYDRMRYDGSSEELRLHHRRKHRIGERKAHMVLTGHLFGYWGAPDYKSLYEYQNACGFDFMYFYSNNMEARVNTIDIEDIIGYNSLIPRSEK